MRKMTSWVLTLGLVASPTLALAGPFGLSNPLNMFRRGEQASAAPAVNNQEMAEAIADALRSARLKGRGIEIEFQDGVVTLVGEVSDAGQKALASSVCSRVPGVQGVTNQMTVASPIRQVSAETTAAPTKSVQNAAFQSPFGEKSAIETVAAHKPKRTESRQQPKPKYTPRAQQRPPVAPQVNTTPVAATPTADSTYYPSAPPAPAPQFGAAKPPVSQVGNFNNGGLSNQEVAEQVATSLKSAGLSGYDIEIRYSNGVCTLGGQVASPAHIVAAVQAASSTPGVESVNNQLGAPQSYGNPYAAAQAGMGGQAVSPTNYMAQGMPMGPQMGMPPQGGPVPAQFVPPGMASPVYNNPSVPEHAWPTYAKYPNYAAVTYPEQYSASAWPYIGPFYPYPQVPLGWRSVTLEWDDGQWYLDFNDRTDRWWWFLSPKNW
ncbi:BON domain-containing protein [Stratiformator vulcanicus]|uniref:Periplasmic protein n=1 Tax=Stratiformator vulcanicus TaxID=2527980 RepID=A0A517R4F4_9PLAN|nr:BON domain-containing protein [Stratiformator vulcanicus]QDT38757.1 periplasmic protein [Stratiformator vulcanicus]